MRIAALLALLLLAAAPARAGEAPSADALAWAREVVAERLADAAPAPAFPGDRAWLNVARPLTLAEDLRGKVVILDFWCYCCINCLHVLPDLAYLERKYADRPFAVVGVHSAKFQNEKDVANLREAVRRYEIEHPVVDDGDFRIWRAYGARSWPTFVVLTPDGRVLGKLSGEGRRDELDALVHVLLERYEQRQGALDPGALPIRLERATRAPGALAYPGKVAVDAERGRLLIADSNHHRIVEISRAGRFRRAWGDGQAGLVDGGPLGAEGPRARFARPQGLTVHDGALWVADTGNHALRRIDLTTGAVTTVAGNGRQGRKRYGVFAAGEAELNSPWDVLWVQGRLHVAMAGSHQLWRYDPATGSVGHFSGDGSERRLDDPDLERAAYAQPSALAFDGTWLYVADSESSAVVRLKLEGPVETLAGATTEPADLFHFGDEDGRGRGRRFQHPLGLALVGGGLVGAHPYNHKIKRVTIAGEAPGLVTSAFGDGTAGATDDPVRFHEPGGLAAWGTDLYVADTNNHAIRVIDTTTGAVTTLALEGVPIPQAAVRTGGMGDGWPQFPDTVSRTLDPVQVAAGAETTLTVELDLPAGWKLTEGAPSMLRIERAGAPRDVPVAGSTVSVPLGAWAAGPHRLTVRLVYYVCEDEGTCRVRGVDWTVPLVAGDGGAAEIRLREAFGPVDSPGGAAGN